MKSIALIVPCVAVVGTQDAWAIDVTKPNPNVSPPQMQRVMPRVTAPSLHNDTAIKKPGNNNVSVRHPIVTSKTKSETSTDIRIQQHMDKDSKFLNTLSNTLKKESDTEDAITKNLK